MNTLTLPRRRAYCFVFWLLMLSGWLLITAGIALTQARIEPILWGSAVAFALVVPGLVYPAWYDLAVGAWNRIVRAFAGRLRALTLRLSFYIVFPLLHRQGSSLTLTRPSDVDGTRTMWRTRADTHPTRQPPGAREGWLSDVMRHARETGNSRMLALLPMLLTLMLLSDEAEPAPPPTSTYTLY
jgi:hypothetical protein